MAAAAALSPVSNFFTCSSPPLLYSCSIQKNNNNTYLHYPFHYKTRKFVISTKTSTNHIHNSSIQPHQQHQEDDDDDDDVIISDKVEEDVSSAADDMLPERWDVLGLGQAMVLLYLYTRLLFAYPIFYHFN
ncbi:hypothetical protein Tco_0021308 [Tanacetum coccineum]